MIQILNILIVEDEPAICDMIAFALAPHGFKTVAVHDAAQAKRHLAVKTPDLILLDWMLPGLSGVKFASDLKRDTATQTIPIIMLTAKAEEANKVQGLDAGADDYITKPFSPKELIARIHAVLRRGGRVSPEGIIQSGPILLNLAEHTVHLKGQRVSMSPILFRLLQYFILHPERVFNREQLLQAVWQGELEVYERTVDVHIRRLRKTLIDHGCDNLIHTVHGVGYQFSLKG